jgi:flagellar biosynthetic protein FlhB
MPEQAGEKSQDATPHRRQKAREEGQVARSQDLGSAVLLLAGLIALLMCGGSLVEFLGLCLKQQLGGTPWLSIDAATAVSQCQGTLAGLAKYLLPILGTLLVTAVAVNLGQTGLLFLPEKLSMDLQRLDPLQGLQRIFSLPSLARLLFGLFKIALIATVAIVALYKERNAILGLTSLDVPEMSAYLAGVLLWTAIKVAVALLILAIFDYAFQWWKQERDLKMTSQEVREEMKNLEGDPQIAARRKAVQRQLIMHRLSDAVPKADVVVTNPTELAVAIQYDPQEMEAPIVVAKGAGVLAQRIRRLALEQGIPIVEKKPLAQALYREVDIDHPIPRDKYAAVAEVLAYVYQLKGKKLPSAAAGF